MRWDQYAYPTVSATESLTAVFTSNQAEQERLAAMSPLSPDHVSPAWASIAATTQDVKKLSDSDLLGEPAMTDGLSMGASKEAAAAVAEEKSVRFNTEESRMPPSFIHGDGHVPATYAMPSGMGCGPATVRRRPA